MIYYLFFIDIYFCACLNRIDIFCIYHIDISIEKPHWEVNLENICGALKFTIFSYSSYSTRHSFKSLNIILASSYWIFWCMVFVTFFHTFHHSGTSAFSCIERSSSKIGCKEISERWILGLWETSSNTGSSGEYIWSWWYKKSWVI